MGPSSPPPSATLPPPKECKKLEAMVRDDDTPEGDDSNGGSLGEHDVDKRSAADEYDGEGLQEETH